MMIASHSEMEVEKGEQQTPTSYSEIEVEKGEPDLDRMVQQVQNLFNVRISMTRWISL